MKVMENLNVIYQSYTDVEETYYIAFFIDGTIVHQSNEYNYIEDRQVNNTFSSAQEFVQSSEHKLIF